MKVTESMVGNIQDQLFFEIALEVFDVLKILQEYVIQSFSKGINTPFKHPQYKFSSIDKEVKLTAKNLWSTYRRIDNFNSASSMRWTSLFLQVIYCKNNYIKCPMKTKKNNRSVLDLSSNRKSSITVKRSEILVFNPYNHFASTFTTECDRVANF